MPENRFFLTLASACSISQSEYLKKKKKRGSSFEMGYFPRLKMWRLSPYQDLLRTGKSRKDAIFLDLGSCGENRGNSSISKTESAQILSMIVGNDARKLVADGYPLEQVVISDLRQGDLFALRVIDVKTTLLAYLVYTCRIRGHRP